MTDSMKQCRLALVALVVTGITQVIFPFQANGNLITGVNGQPIGSAWCSVLSSTCRYV